MFRSKKSEIRRRAKRLLNSFAEETRKQSIDSLMSGQRKLIRAHYEKGLLVLREDFIRLPNGYGAGVSLQFQIISNLLSVLKNELCRNKSDQQEHFYLQKDISRQASD